MKPLHDMSDEELGAALARAQRELPSAPAAWREAAVALMPSPLAAAGAALGRLVRAVLTFDSWAQHATAEGLRSTRQPTRHLLYSAQGRDLDLRIAPGPEHFVLSGQVLGPDDSGRIELDSMDAGQRHSAELDDLGEFRIDGVRAGRYRLLLHVGDAPVMVEPLDVGAPAA